MEHGRVSSSLFLSCLGKGDCAETRAEWRNGAAAVVVLRTLRRSIRHRCRPLSASVRSSVALLFARQGRGLTT